MDRNRCHDVLIRANCSLVVCVCVWCTSSLSRFFMTVVRKSGMTWGKWLG